MLPTPPAVRRSAVRAGFTLVELLVACALTVLVMAILATAFGKGMETLSHLKSAVGLSEQLRSAQAILQADLAAQHLERPDGTLIRVSDPQHRATAAGWGTVTNPGKGFFRVRHGSNPVAEGTEDGVTSYRAIDHELAMTVKLTGGSAQNVFVAKVSADLGAGPYGELIGQSRSDHATTPGQQFAGSWGEVQYFLAESAQTTTDAGAGGLQLYTLRRRFRALMPTRTVEVPLAPDEPTSLFNSPQQVADAYPELSVSPVVLVKDIDPGPPVVNRRFATINTPSAAADVRHRMWDYVGADAPPDTGTATPARPEGFTDSVRAFSAAKPDYYGSDVLISNVVSMQVQVLTTSDETGFVANLPTGNAIDTFTPTTGVRLRAVQIKLRIYDVRNKLTRQMTIAQDL